MPGRLPAVHEAEPSLRATTLGGSALRGPLDCGGAIAGHDQRRLYRAEGGHHRRACGRRQVAMATVGKLSVTVAVLGVFRGEHIWVRATDSFKTK